MKYHTLFVISWPEPKAQGELIGWELSGCPSVCPHFQIQIEISWLMAIKFHQKHNWGGGLTALGFGPDQIRTLVSMATDSSHRVIMGKTL